MFSTIYIVVTLFIFIGIGVWVSKKVFDANKRWDKAYIARYWELVKSLPPSEIFPATLQQISFPRVGSGSALTNSRDSVGIIYIKDGLVMVEQVGSQDTAPFYKSYGQIEAPAATLAFRNAEPEATFPGKGSYVLESKDDTGAFCLVGEFVTTKKDVRTDADIMKWQKNLEGQQAIRKTLLEAGVTIR